MTEQEAERLIACVCAWLETFDTIEDYDDPRMIERDLFGLICPPEGLGAITARRFAHRLLSAAKANGMGQCMLCRS